MKSRNPLSTFKDISWTTTLQFLQIQIKNSIQNLKFFLKKRGIHYLPVYTNCSLIFINIAKFVVKYDRKLFTIKVKIWPWNVKKTTHTYLICNILLCFCFIASKLTSKKGLTTTKQTFWLDLIWEKQRYSCMCKI